MINFLKKYKKDFIMWFLVLLIFGLIFLIVYYENKDKNHYTNVACNSDINIVDDKLYKNDVENYSVLYNVFNNSIGKLYTQDTNILILSETISLNSADVSISMNNFPNIFNYLNDYDYEDTSTYPTQYFYFTIDLSGSTNSPLVFSLNNAILDTNVILYYNDIQLYSFTRENDKYHIYVNQDTIYTFNKIYYDSFYVPDYVDFELNISTEGILYNKGFNDGVDSIKFDYQQLQTQYNNLQTQYNILDSNYQSLLEQYNSLNSGEYSLSELIWSIGSVPFAVLTSGFNVNVMGISLASIITGLFTSMLLIWIIKKFFR